MKEKLYEQDETYITFESLEAQVAENIHKTGWYAQYHAQTFFKNFGLTLQQYNIIRILFFEEKGLPSLELANRMIQKMPDITRLIDRIEKAGYVKRNRSELDRRVVTVKLTDRGKKMVKSLEQPIAEYAKTNLAHFSEKELKELNRLLMKARHED